MGITGATELARARAAMSGGAARELAGARREAAALRRENDRLRARLALLDGPPPATAARPEQAPRRCRRCGLTVAAQGPDAVLVLAGCCPHCDGRLATADEPSTYLG